MTKKTSQIIFDEKIIENTLEDVMHNSFMTYSEYVILERALPRAEDGLKPVQRRILYTMHTLGLTPDKPYKKSARIVGEALGKYHPHGDTSVYDAMVRLAQDFVMRAPLTDGHGNFGSMDGDSAAAMRYTEARMSPLALELLRDLDKDTVPFRPNFDDSEMEPDMLPARYPNLLVNGASGIAVGLATNIPPHNLGEVIGGVVYRMEHPDCALADVLRHIKGPDFPTGGLIVNPDALAEAYRTGKGKIYVRARTHFEKTPGGKPLIVITEVPYETKKSAMLEKILAVSEQKKELFSGIDDIRDESDREGVRAVIELKKGVDAQKILGLLFKYTDLQITFGINMMVIAKGAPVQAGLLELIDYYIEHQKNVVTRRTRFDLEKAEKREHILAGLIVAVANIDLVVKIIRGSADTKEARTNLMKRFDLTGVQAQAILDMRLARLTSLEIYTLKQEYADIQKLIAELQSILASEQKLLGVIRTEMLEIKQKYADPRRTHFVDGQDDVEVDESEFKVVEECAVILCNQNHLKRMSPRALQKGLEAGIDEKNEPRILVTTNTDAKLSVFTSKGNLYIMPVAQIAEARLKDAGKALPAMIAGVDKQERIVNMFVFDNYDGNLLFATKNGLVKQVKLAEFDVRKSKILACGLKDGDEILLVDKVTEDPNVLFISKKGMAINIRREEISTMGRSGKGVGAMKLARGDELVLACQVAPAGGMVYCMTEKGYAKATSIAEYDVQGRNGKGLKTFVLGEQTGESLVGAFVLTRPGLLTVKQTMGDITMLKTDDIPGLPRYSKGEQVVLALMGNDVQSVMPRIFE